MSQRSQIIEACLYLTDKLCDQDKPWSEVKVYFPEWLNLIHMWRDLDKGIAVSYTKL